MRVLGPSRARGGADTVDENWAPVTPATKVAEWVRRYGPIELAGAICAVGVALLVNHWTGSLATSAVAGAWAECLGYYGAAGWLEMRRSTHEAAALGPASRASRLLTTVRTLVIEFGPAEVIDTALVRPALMFAAPLLLGSVGVGLLVGKIAADAVFYAIVIRVYEARKRAVTAPSEGLSVQPA